MFGRRTNCFGCHTEMASDKHGGEVFKATLTGCRRATAIAMRAPSRNEAGAGIGVDGGGRSRTPASCWQSQDIPEARDARPRATAALRPTPVGERTDCTMTYAIEVLDTVTQRAQQAIHFVEAQPARSLGARA
jgi:hypothetical protein